MLSNLKKKNYVTQFKKKYYVTFSRVHTILITGQLHIINYSLHVACTMFVQYYTITQYQKIFKFIKLYKLN